MNTLDILLINYVRASAECEYRKERTLPNEQSLEQAQIAMRTVCDNLVQNRHHLAIFGSPKFRSTVLAFLDSYIESLNEYDKDGKPLVEKPFLSPSELDDVRWTIVQRFLYTDVTINEG